MPSYLFTSARLGFRHWTAGDMAPFFALNADPKVMEFFVSPYSPEESEAFSANIQRMFDEYHYGLYAVDVLENQAFIGFIGFWHPRITLDISPFTEMSWRLKASAWGKGYASEGALRCIRHGFEVLGFEKLYAMTASINLRSERVMQKIGMYKDREFDHPLLDAGSHLQRHVLYCIDKAHAPDL